jgi:hypothetical protein
LTAENKLINEETAMWRLEEMRDALQDLLVTAVALVE